MKVFTDGACRGNPGPGSWAFVAVDNAEIELGHRSGFASSTTNNRMELTAVLNALEWGNDYELCLDIHSDSNYVVRGLTEWLVGWKKRNWKSAKGDPIANVDVWKRTAIAWENNKHRVSWVKGHSSSKGNYLADKYCNEELDKHGF